MWGTSGRFWILDSNDIFLHSNFWTVQETTSDRGQEWDEQEAEERLIFDIDPSRRTLYSTENWYITLLKNFKIRSGFLKAFFFNMA